MFVSLLCLFVFFNFEYRPSRLRIKRLTSCVIQGRDDLPRISFDSMHSWENLSRVVLKSVQSYSTVFPKWFDMKLCWYSFILDLSFGQSALLKRRTLCGFCLCWGGFNSALAETRSWSPRPGEHLTSVIRVGFVVRNRSKMLSCRVGS